jgi:hypothetical protein
VPNFERRFQAVIIVNFSDSKQSDISKGLHFNLQKVLSQYTKLFLRKKHFSAKKILIIFTLFTLVKVSPFWTGRNFR